MFNFKQLAQVVHDVEAGTLRDRHSLHNFAKKLGAVCYETQGAVGDGPEPKLQLLEWAEKRSSFVPCGSVQSDPDMPVPPLTVPRFTLSPPDAPTMLETTPRPESSVESPNSNGSRVAPQLPRAAQPVIPLLYGTLKGWPLYAEFSFTWEEKGNGEACQLGVSTGSDEDLKGAVQLKFSPSAGAMFQQRPEGSFRMWPMEDLWVDAYQPGTRTFLEAGVYISARGQIAFYRKGPYTLEHKGEGARQLNWEVAGGFECEFPNARERFHIALCLLDEQTPLVAKIVRIGSEPPVPPVAPSLARQVWVPETHV